MSEAVLMEEGYCAMLDALTSGMNAYVHLYCNDPDLDEPRTSSDFVEPVYDGYGPVSATKWTPAVLRAGLAWSVADLINFTCSGPTYPDPIRGYFATMGRTGPLLWAWRRPGGEFVFGGSQTLLTINVKMTFPHQCPEE